MTRLMTSQLWAQTWEPKRFRTRSAVLRNQFFFGGTGSATGTETAASITTNDSVEWECCEWASGSCTGLEGGIASTGVADAFSCLPSASVSGCCGAGAGSCPIETPAVYDSRTLGVGSGAGAQTTRNCFALLNGPRSSRHVLPSTAFRQSDGNASISSVTSAMERFDPSAAQICVAAIACRSN